MAVLMESASMFELAPRLPAKPLGVANSKNQRNNTRHPEMASLAKPPGPCQEQVRTAVPS
jgi:hypothetical protein